MKFNNKSKKIIIFPIRRCIIIFNKNESFQERIIKIKFEQILKIKGQKNKLNNERGRKIQNDEIELICIKKKKLILKTTLLSQVYTIISRIILRFLEFGVENPDSKLSSNDMDKCWPGCCLILFSSPSMS